MDKSGANRNYLGLIIGFCLVLILPMLNGILGVWEFERRDENRTFQDQLHIDIKNLDRFPKEADAYLNDNFSFRKPLLDFYHHLKFRYFKTSPHPDKLILGSEGWMFMNDKEMEIFLGTYSFPDSTLQAIKTEWNRRLNYYKEREIPAYWFIPPLKHFVYPDKLPIGYTKGDVCRTQLIIDALQEDFSGRIIYPLDEFKNKKSRLQSYHKLDNHWTYPGAKYGSELLLQAIKHDFPNETFESMPEIAWKDTLVANGIHTNLLGMKGISEKIQKPVYNQQANFAPRIYQFKIPEHFPYKWTYECRYVNPNAKSDLKILVFRDSFGKMMIPFFKEYFKETLFIFDAWDYGFNQHILEAYNPDIVIYLSSEINLEAFAK